MIIIFGCGMGEDDSNGNAQDKLEEGETKDKIGWEGIEMRCCCDHVSLAHHSRLALGSLSVKGHFRGTRENRTEKRYMQKAKWFSNF